MGALALATVMIVGACGGTEETGPETTSTTAEPKTTTTSGVETTTSAPSETTTTEPMTTTTEAMTTPSADADEAIEIEMEDLAFDPSELTVEPGTTVTWTNNDSVVHTSTSDDGTWDSGDLAPGESFSYTFEEAGTYPFHCEIHSQMQGTVTVESP